MIRTFLFDPTWSYLRVSPKIERAQKSQSLSSCLPLKLQIRFFRFSAKFILSAWLVVSTPLKNISQLGVLFPIYGKIKAMFQTTNQLFIVPDQVPTRMRISVWKHPYREGHGVRKHAIVFHLSNYPVVHPKIAHVQMFILKKKGLQCTLW